MTTPPRRPLGGTTLGDASPLLIPAAILVSLLVGAVLIAASDPDVVSALGYFAARPGDTIAAAWLAVSEAYAALFRGAVVDPRRIAAALDGASWAPVFGPLSETLVLAVPLILAGLAFAVTLRAGLFNIGAEGQMVLGAICAAWVGFALSLPPVLHLLVALGAGILGGALWGWIAGWLKARTGAHEVITTIMLNYVAAYLLLYLLSTAAFRRPGREDPISPVVRDTAALPSLSGIGLRVHLGVLVALAVAALTWWMINRTTWGYEVRAVGLNAAAATTAGMNAARVHVQAFLAAGALAGVAGATLVLSAERTLTPGISSGLGFDAIVVALLGRSSPTGIVLASLLFAGLRAGGIQMQAATAIPVDVVTIVQAVMVLLVAAPPLIGSVLRLGQPRQRVAA